MFYLTECLINIWTAVLPPASQNTKNIIKRKELEYVRNINWGPNTVAELLCSTINRKRHKEIINITIANVWIQTLHHNCWETYTKNCVYAIIMIFLYYAIIFAINLMAEGAATKLEVRKSSYLDWLLKIQQIMLKPF